MSTTAPPPEATTAPLPDLRARLLHEAFDRMLQRSLTHISLSNFGTCFPTTSSRNPHLLAQIHSSAISALDRRSREEFAKILDERDALRKLNELDALVRDAEKRAADAPPGVVPVAPTSLAPVQLVEVNVTPLLKEAAERLGADVAAVEDANRRVVGEIEEQREEMVRLLEVLGRRMEQVEGAVEEVQSAVAGERWEEEMMGLEGVGSG